MSTRAILNKEVEVEGKFHKKEILMRLPIPLVYLLDKKLEGRSVSRNELVISLLWGAFSDREIAQVLKENPQLEARAPGRVRKPKKRSFTNPYDRAFQWPHPKKGMILLAPYETVEWMED